MQPVHLAQPLHDALNPPNGPILSWGAITP